MSKEQITLERRGTVKVFVNGQLIRTLQLEPGTHRLLNFPYLSGVNDVRLVIQEEGKEERIVDRYVSFDGRLQPAGDFTASAGAGIPRWDTSFFLAQGSFLYGVTSWFTAGMNLQGAKERQLVGVETLVALPLGILLSDYGVSVRHNRWEDQAAALKYRVSFPGRPELPVVGIGLQYKGKDFHTPLDPEDAPAPPAWELSGLISKSFPFGLSLGVSANYQWVREGDPKLFTSLSLLQTLRKGATLVFSFSTSIVQGTPQDTRGSIALTLSSPDGRQSSSFTSFPWEDTASATVQVRPEVPNATVVIDGAVEGMPVQEGKPSSFRAQGSYANRFLESSLTATFFRGSTDYVSNRLTGQLRSAIVYIDGVVGFSKPLSDSYALVVPAESLQEETLFVSSSSSGDAVATKKLPALLPLNAYETSRLLIDAPEAPPSYEVGSNVRILRPSYRSGTLVKAGSTPTVYVEGTFLFPDGKPVALQAGKLVREGSGENQEEGVSFFTDEAGVFQAYKLVPGTYTVRFFSSLPSIPLTIPEGSTGFVPLGTFTVPTK